MDDIRNAPRDLTFEATKTAIGESTSETTPTTPDPRDGEPTRTGDGPTTGGTRTDPVDPNLYQEPSGTGTVPMQPNPLDPVPMQPNPAEVPVDPAPIQIVDVNEEPEPIESHPVDPGDAATEIIGSNTTTLPSQPNPLDPVPMQPNPAEVPVDPAPIQIVDVNEEPEPIESHPVDLGDAATEIIGSNSTTLPSQPNPLDPVPMQPNPLDPVPMQPNPAEVPVNPNPAEAPLNPNPAEAPLNPNPAEVPLNPNPAEVPVNPNPAEQPTDPNPFESPLDPPPPPPVVRPADPPPNVVQPVDRVPILTDQGLSDWTAEAGQQFTFTLSAGAFADPEGGPLRYTATLADGTALPGWLTFDSSTLTFSGQVPGGEADFDIEVTITAMDRADQRVSDTFTLSVEGLKSLDIDFPEPETLNQVIGTATSNRVSGSMFGDLVVGGKGRDILLGRGGEDIFQFTQGDGKDVIRDFETAPDEHDFLDLRDWIEVADVTEFLDDHVRDTGKNLVLTNGEGDRIVLKGVDLAELTTDLLILA